jgi:hypothetical protein
MRIQFGFRNAVDSSSFLECGINLGKHGMFAPTLESQHILDGLRNRMCGQTRFLIGVDGLADSGKASLAKWFGDHLAVPVISLDAYLIADRRPACWQCDELIRDLTPRAIIEGARLTAALQAIDRTLDVLIWTDSTGIYANALDSIVEEYLTEFESIATTRVRCRR